MGEEKEKPLTREDVLRLIKENGGKAEGLDLSRKVFVECIDLSDLDLSGILLNKASFLAEHDLADTDRTSDSYIKKIKGANLRRTNLRCAELAGAQLAGAHLEESDLSFANLARARLSFAHLENASLFATHLEEACLSYGNLDNAYLVRSYLNGAILRGTYLYGTDLRSSNLERVDLADAYLEGVLLHEARFSHDSRLEEANWGNHILGEEKSGSFEWAVDTYRQLKIWYTEHGQYDVASEFFYREMTVKRKALKWWPNPFPRAWSKLISMLCGYGERPLQVIAAAILAIVGLALLYFAIGTITPNTFLNSLYYSAVSFTALGYGSWAPQPIGWIKGLGVFEAFLGVFMMALFLVTFTRKMTR